MADRGRKDISWYENAKRLMEEEDYEQALTNWNYLIQRGKGNNLEVQLGVAKCQHYLNDDQSSRKRLTNIIKAFETQKSDEDPTIYIESLNILGAIELDAANYKTAVQAFEVLIEYVNKNEIRIPEEFMENVEKSRQIARSAFKEHGENRNTRPSENKQVPYPTGEKPKKKTLRAKPFQRLKDIPSEKQKQEMDRLWGEMESKKMQIEEGSKWYLISTVWFNQWKEWAAFSTKSPKADDDTTNEGIEASDSHRKGSKIQEPGRIDNVELIEFNEIMLFGEINLKDNLNEEEDYIIVSPTIWRYLYSIYDGIPIIRKGIKNF